MEMHHKSYSAPQSQRRMRCNISVWRGGAGDEVASPTLKNWPLFGQKFSKRIQLHSHVSEVVSIFQTRAK